MLDHLLRVARRARWRVARWLGPSERARWDVPDVGLSLDEFFDVLSNRRRRLAIRLVDGAARAGDGYLAKRELVTQIAALETGKRPGRVSRSERKRAYSGLHQWHLEPLDEAGLIEYYPDHDVVCATEATAPVAAYLRASAAAVGGETTAAEATIAAEAAAAGDDSPAAGPEGEQPDQRAAEEAVEA